MEKIKKDKWELRWEQIHESIENEKLQSKKIQENIKKEEEEKKRLEFYKKTLF